MTVIVEQEPVETSDDSAVAFAAGETAAHVETVAAEVAKVEAVAEEAAIVAEVAAATSSEVQSVLMVIVDALARIEAKQEALERGMLLLPGMFDSVVEKLEEQNLPPAPEPKRDSAPKRKSDAHRFLYGSK